MSVNETAARNLRKAARRRGKRGVGIEGICLDVFPTKSLYSFKHSTYKILLERYYITGQGTPINHASTQSEFRGSATTGTTGTTGTRNS
eukprot:1126531-Rhodomonas_salina.4